MFSSTALSGLWTIAPSALRWLRPATSLSGRPSATSAIVKSNSFLATKSTAGAALRLFSASTATLAPMSPALRSGLTAFSASTAATSWANDGVDV